MNWIGALGKFNVRLQQSDSGYWHAYYNFRWLPHTSGAWHPTLVGAKRMASETIRGYHIYLHGTQASSRVKWQEVNQED